VAVSRVRGKVLAGGTGWRWEGKGQKGIWRRCFSFSVKKKREIKGIFAGANDRTTPTHAHYVCVF
jgi:hypothetical protein